MVTLSIYVCVCVLKAFWVFVSWTKVLSLLLDWGAAGICCCCSCSCFCCFFFLFLILGISSIYPSSHCATPTAPQLKAPNDEDDAETVNKLHFSAVRESAGQMGARVGVGGWCSVSVLRGCCPQIKTKNLFAIYFQLTVFFSLLFFRFALPLSARFGCY